MSKTFKCIKCGIDVPVKTVTCGPCVSRETGIVDMMGDIKDFHEKFSLSYNGKPRALPQDMAEFRRRFMQEELQEYTADSYRAEYFVAMLATTGPDQWQRRIAQHLEGSLDALVDLVYVALGTAYQQGFDFNEAWRRVHAANMAKVRVERIGDSDRGSMYDVVKPKDWMAPNHFDLVADNVHRMAERTVCCPFCTLPVEPGQKVVSIGSDDPWRDLAHTACRDEHSTEPPKET